MRASLIVSTDQCVMFVSLLLFGTCARAADAPPVADVSPTGKVYELRVYHANSGKLEALHSRFRDHTCKLFQKHGMELIGFWTPTDGDEAKNTLIYILAFPSVE